MAKPRVETGYSTNGLPFVRIGEGSSALVVFEGLNYHHKPPSGMMLRFSTGFVSDIAKKYSVYIVGRKPNLPDGYSMRDMSNDYATMIRDSFKGPVDIMGTSTGGPIAQWFCVDHPDLVSHLVLAVTGYRLSDNGKKLQRRMIDFSKQGDWRGIASCLAEGMFSGAARPIFKILFWLMGKSMFGSVTTPSDGLVELEAEDKHNFKNHLKEIKAPTLVIGGDRDAFYPIEETASYIPKARLVLYKGAGHSVIMKRDFQKDVLDFLLRR
jgi:pimeloyl-ACP methyl ester carboxylesterase